MVGEYGGLGKSEGQLATLSKGRANNTAYTSKMLF